MKKPKVILIAGPTGVGKTALSIELAKKLDTEIISCDSMQIYKGMDIGTAKVTPDETQGVVHHIIDILDPWENFSAWDYVKAATPVIYDLDKRGKCTIVAGGTGLYADLLINGTSLGEKAGSLPSYREEMGALLKEKGAEYIHSLLGEVDPESAEKIHPNNTKRVIRALEYYKATGKKISSHNEKTKEEESPFCSLKFYLTRGRENLYKRIDQRVDKMIKDGLFGEVKTLFENEKGLSTTASQGLGYKEIIEVLKGNTSLEEATELIKRDSRRYAKRQLTWFRRDEEGIWIDLDEFSSQDEVLRHILNIAKERNML